MKKDSLTLVHITTVPESLWGFLWGQIGFMKQRGFEIQAVSSPGELLDRFAAREQVAVQSVSMPRKITPWRDCIALLGLWRILRKIRPDIVHSHTPKGGLLGMAAAWLAAVPVRVYHLRGLPLMTASGLKWRILQWSEKISCRLAHQVICISHSIRHEAVQLGLCPAQKIRVLGAGGNGVDAQNKFNPQRLEAGIRERMRAACNIPEHALVLGFVGRIVRDKGIIELTAAWQILREQFPSLHLLVVGPFESRDAVPKEVETLLHNDPRIHLVGPVRETPPYYATMDVCALPTYREGFPNVLLEAAAMELPVVATQIPGCKDAVVDGTTGILVPPHDDKALADALRIYLDTPSLRQQHGQAGRQRVLRDFCPEMIWEALYQEYINLLREKALPLPVEKQFLTPMPLTERHAA
jgi:glycosyltransferase involved in cell wall biosynthesis